MGVKQDAQASAKESDQGKRNMLNQQLVLYSAKSSIVTTHASVMDYSSMEPQMPLS